MTAARQSTAERRLRRLGTELPLGVRARLAAQRLLGRSGGDARTTARLRLAVVVVLALVVVAAAVVGIRAATGQSTMTIHADFTEAPGIYQGNHVDVLGIPVGTVTAVDPHPGGVDVTMVVRRSLAVPATVHAVLEAPDVVSDRYVELTPVYRHGPRLAGGATIPQRRTAVPLSLDQILDTFDQLAVALGPNGANKNGAVAALVHQLAEQLNGNGPALHSTIASLGSALGALTGKGPSLTETLDNLGSLTSALANADGTYQQFTTTAASVAQTLAADRGSLAGALSELQQALGQVAAFVQQNGSALGASIGNLQSTVSALDQDQQQLASAWDLGALAFQNFNGAIDTSAPGGPALVAMLDPSSDSAALVDEVCGNSDLRGVDLVVKQSAASELDVACDASYGLTALNTPPGSSTGPDMSLSALVGASS